MASLFARANFLENKNSLIFFLDVFLEQKILSILSYRRRFLQNCFSNEKYRFLSRAMLSRLFKVKSVLVAGNE